MDATKNSLIVERVLSTLTNIIARETSLDYSALILDDILLKLKEKHTFLKYINIRKNKCLDKSDLVVVDKNIDLINQKDVGKAIKEIIMDVNKIHGLENKFFMPLFEGHIGRSFCLKIKNAGVDI
ncbi:MAG: hypothetical protein KAQ92_08670 [Candidatus Aenigmarchaeota archaeon]|nr:hypothetical protein [Candidatus Aenigmarchaeota archaeon]